MDISWLARLRVLWRAVVHYNSEGLITGLIMFSISSILIVIHVFAAIVWVGGMFFAYIILRPSLSSAEPPRRLALWGSVFQRFFPWVWLSVLALPLTGYVLIFVHFGGFSGAGVHIHIMQLTGLLMIGLFGFLYYRPYQEFKRAIGEQTWPEAAGHLNTIRIIVGINLILGLLTSVVGASGRFWG